MNLESAIKLEAKAAGWSSGRTVDSGSTSPGSNPGPAAKNLVNIAEGRLLVRMRKVGYGIYKGFLETLLNELRIGFGRDNILAFAVFGSVARGEAKPHSDIDILVVRKELVFNLMHKFVDLLFKMKEGRKYRQLTEQGLQPEPYPVFMTEGELLRRPHILLDVLDHGTILYDTGG